MQPQRTGSDPGVGSQCPGRDRVRRFVEGTLPADAEDDLRAHTDVCATCRRLVADIGAGGGESGESVAEPMPKTREVERDVAIALGAVIGGKYRIERLLGAGGMGKVFAAIHIDLGHTLAIKLMHPEMARDADSVKRFLREGRAAALLKSDHAARINDVGRLPSGVPYLVMEYLEGEDLDRRRKRAPLSAGEVVHFTLQALAAITEAHGVGLVHRDIKPQNLFLARLPDGGVRVKVLDFGLVKDIVSADRSSSALTTDNMILGSPHFMSPEQIRNPITVDGRTDIWAIGATMFMLLTGRPPFISKTTHGLLALILTEAPARASASNPAVPPWLDDIIDRCMARDIEARFQTTLDLTEALRAHWSGESAHTSTRAPVAPPTVQAPFGSTGADVDDELGATRVQPASSPALLAHVAPAVAQPTLLAAGAVPMPTGVPATLPLGVQSPGVPPTVPMVGTAPMATVPNPALASTMPSPSDPADAKVAGRHPATLLSEPMRLPPSLAPAEPGASSVSFVSGAVHGVPRPGSARRAATAVLVFVMLAAGVVGIIAVRTTHRSTPAPAETAGIRAIDPPAPSESATATATESPAPSASAATSATATASAVAPPPPLTAAASTATPPAAKKPVRPTVPPGPVTTGTKDPYSWGK